jgi:signal peptidase I
MQDAHKAEYDVALSKPKSRVKLVVLLIVGLVLVPPILYVAAIVFVAQPVKVEGAAMSPTLNDGDRIFIWKRFSSLQRGDIVVFLFPEDRSKSFIKRVVGLPGEAIDMDVDGRITINGGLIEEPYVRPDRNQTARARWRSMREDFKHVSSDSYFVMGDNRDASNDSRSWGTVPKSLIYGKFMSRYWPLKAVN